MANVWCGRIVPLAAILAALTTPCLGSGVLPLTIEVRARAFAPGEPVRVDVVSRLPLETLSGEFLGHETFFVCDGPGDGGEHWSAWTMIDLDQASGLAAVEVRGLDNRGREVGGTRAVTVESREFPNERIQVQAKYVDPPPEVRKRLDEDRRRLKTLYLSRRPVTPATTPFVRPVPGDPTSVFGTRRLYNGKPRSPHPGLDLHAATGTPVASAGAGRVGMARDLYYSGNTVIVDHGGGLFTLYAHLSEIQVREGDEIEAGQRVGLSGATGRVTGPHLHWGAKIGDRPFDPMALLDRGLF